MKIMLVDDDCGSRDTVKSFLHMLGHEVVEYENGIEALQALPCANVSLLITDIKMPHMTGMELMKAASKLPLINRPPVVLLTGYGTMESAIDAMRAGAFDYLLKPINAEEIVKVINRIEKKIHVSDVVAQDTEVKQKIMLGSHKLEIFSPVMEEILRQSLVFHSHREIPVLLRGETGTGKELIARFIHCGNDKEDRPFVDINCATMSLTLLESELFGYEGGAFTGGRASGQRGKIDLAQGGTLFLDEIAEIPIEMQSKLLRFIQETEFYRVGGLKKNKADVRIISATNQNLETAVSEGRFRKDLYYRLKVGQITIPPLRQRIADIIPLTQSFLTDASRRMGKQFHSISPEAKFILENYSWPGNVRELLHLIELVVLMNHEEKLEKKHLHAIMALENSGSSAGPLVRKGLISKRINFEDIMVALERTAGNKKEAAKYLNISRRTLYRLLAENEIK